MTDARLSILPVQRSEFNRGRTLIIRLLSHLCVLCAALSLLF